MAKEGEHINILKEDKNKRKTWVWVPIVEEVETGLGEVEINNAGRVKRSSMKKASENITATISTMQIIKNNKRISGNSCSSEINDNSNMANAGISTAAAKLTSGPAAKRQKQQMGTTTSTSTIPSQGKPAKMTSAIPNLPQAAPPQKKRVTLDAQVPVIHEKPEPVNKQPINALMQMQDFSKSMENHNNQFKREMERIQKHCARNFMVTNDFAEKMKEICEKAVALNAVINDSVNIQPVRKRIQLTIKKCPEVFTKDKFLVESTPIELFGFKWSLAATTKEKGYLALFLVAELPNGFTGNYRIEVECRFSILNASLADKDLIKGGIGGIEYTVWGCPNMAKFEDLLDPNKTFLTRDGDIETWVDFTIKSSTLNHLT